VVLQSANTPRWGAVVSGLLTTRDVAELLGVTPETVLRWIETRGLPAIRLTTRALRYREAEIERWLEERATAAPVREAPATLSDTAAMRVSSPLPAIPPRTIAVLTEED